MNRRTTVTLLIVLALLAVIAYYLKSNPSVAGATPTPTVDTGGQVLWAVDVTQLAAFSVTDSSNGATFEAVVDDQGLWEITQPRPGEGDQQQLYSAYMALGALSVSRTLTDVANLADFGLVNPAYALTVTQKDGVVLRAVIGAKAPTGSAYYVLRAGETQPVLVQSYSLEPLLNMAKNPPFVTPTATLAPLPGSSGTPAPVSTP
ncbi:MAG: DUF4340 domain-containing protein [Chloroflexi bacterium]|nr:DUF4340 domain-containing protein [Chloroflexota bacterium]